MTGFMAVACTLLVSAQTTEITHYEGTWTGTMNIYKADVLIDTVNVVHTIQPLKENVWTWKTEYFSSSNPLVKDYKIIKSDSIPNEFIIDEGDGLLLYLYAFGDKMISSFETGGFLINSTDYFMGDHLIFEITSARVRDQNHADVKNYVTSNLQRVVLMRAD